MDAVLWPLIGRGRRELAPDDVDGALALYGASSGGAPRRAGCSVGAVPSPRGAGALLLGLAAALLWVRRR